MALVGVLVLGIGIRRGSNFWWGWVVVGLEWGFVSLGDTRRVTLGFFEGESDSDKLTIYNESDSPFIVGDLIFS